MIDLTGVTHHPAVEEIVEVLCNKTENTDRGFFRTEVAYYLGKMAASMRAVVVTKNRGEMPVNIYALALATSGYGKGHSVNIIENELLKGFKRSFMENTLPVMAEQNLQAIANERALRNVSDQGEEFEKVSSEYRRLGAYAFTFDDGTVPAVKQLRNKLILANAGSINYQVDEIGSNLERSMEMLNLYLELYDQGLVKQKLTKNTTENLRSEELDGASPSNMLLFGTPAKLFDGGKTEDMFYSLLETGYARRCLFGYGNKIVPDGDVELSRDEVAELYYVTINPQHGAAVKKWATHFETLADPARFGWKMAVEDEVGILLFSYKLQCERLSRAMREVQAPQKAEMEHRYNKALKLAGAYAFVDGSNEVEMGHILSAILLVEESGEAFQQILHREKAHVRLGRYIAEIGSEVTQHDLMDSLPFYKGSNGARRDMMDLAISWGYKHNVIIKKTFVNGTVEQFRGETLKATDLAKMRVSYSEHWAYNYAPEEVPFENLDQLALAPGYNFCNHHFKNEHRSKENAIPGFNLLVFDVDGGISLATVHELLKDYRFMTYTTKRHTEEENRFRVLLPTNFVLELEDDEYKELYNDVLNWLPFKSSSPDADMDVSANQRSKKYLTHEDGQVHFHHDGDLFDVLPFIPRTKRNEDYRQGYAKVANLGNLERWFAERMVDGNRNNHMLKFALALVDGGADLLTVTQQVHAFNTKLPDPLAEDEIDRTIMVTVAKRYQRAV
jgi:hypothetical protein